MRAKSRSAAFCRREAFPRWIVLAAIVALGAAPIDEAAAQQPAVPPTQFAPTTPTPAPFEILLTPYLWLPWTSSTVRPGNTAIPSASTTIDPGTLISHLTWIPFMGSAEFRSGSFGVLVDYLHSPVKTGVNGGGAYFSGATAGLTEDSGTAMFLYRVFAEPEQSIDVGAGVRAWGLDGQIKLNQGLLPATTLANGLSWADPLIGGRYHRELGDGFGATAYADVGGFGLGAHIDWQLLATIDYRATSWIDLHGGFRSLNYNYGGALASFSEHLYGPILAVTFHFSPQVP